MFHDCNTFICIYLVYSLSFISFDVWVLSLLFCLLVAQLSRSKSIELHYSYMN